MMKPSPPAFRNLLILPYCTSAFSKWSQFWVLSHSVTPLSLSWLRLVLVRLLSSLLLCHGQGPWLSTSPSWSLVIQFAGFSLLSSFWKCSVHLAFTSILLLMRFPFLSITVVFCRELSSHSIFVSPYSVFTWENSHRREFHTGITFWFRIAFTWWLGHFIPRYLKVHFMTIKYTCDSKLKTLRMRYPFQSTDTPVSHPNGWSFRVYMIQSRDFVPEWKSHPGTRTGLHSRRGDSHRYDILWWYHVNKYRAMRGNRILSKLALGQKSPRCHVALCSFFCFVRNVLHPFQKHFVG